MRIKGVSRRGRTVLGPGELVSAAAREAARTAPHCPSASADLQDLPETPQSSSAATEWQPGWIISIVLSAYKQALCFSHDPAILKPDFLFLGSHRGSLLTTKASRKSPAGLNFLMLHSPPPSSSHPPRGRNLSSEGQHPVSCLHPYLCAGWRYIYFSLHSRPIQRLRETHQWNV